MATESRTGFRLPWSLDNRPVAAGEHGDHATNVDEPVDDSGTAPEANPDGSDTDGALALAEGAETPDAAVATSPSDEPAATADADAAADSAATGPVELDKVDGAAGLPAGEAGSATAAAHDRRPSRFLTELTNAMRAAAESARDRSLSQYQADATAFVERVHADAAERVTEYRQQADSDVAGIREWSKAEIARIREETERRISGRRAQLESDLQEHAARTDREIERVQARVAEFEAQMSRFFGQLLEEEDPSRFGALAANLPEPPAFEAVLAEAEAAETAPSHVEATAATQTDTTPEATVAVDVDEASAAPEGELATEAEAAPEGAIAPEAQSEGEAASEPEATSEADETGLPVIDAAPSDVASVEGADVGEPAETIADPRVALLGLTPDFAAAEAEAALAPDVDETWDEAYGDGSEGEPPENEADLADDALASRLASLVPAPVEPAQPTIIKTQVVIVGLVSVASIASFKRHLGRVPNVQSVGVSSGPDGEFVFTVAHRDDVDLREIVPNLPGFKARVTSAGEGIVNATAHDPESES